MLTRLKYFSAIGLLMFGLVSSASAANCKTFMSSTAYGSTPYNTTTLVIGPITTKCTGGFGGSLNNLSRAWLTVQLEKQNSSGSWSIVNSGYIAYTGEPGTYRYTVINTGNGDGSWSVNYSYPVF